MTDKETFEQAQTVWEVGDKAYCRVHGAEGWHTVTAVKGPPWDQRIKVDGVGAWCPAYNFKRTSILQ